MTSERNSHGGGNVISGDARRQHIENYQVKKDHDWEKRVIEKVTAEAFLKLYNNNMMTSYRIVEHRDSPDFLCRDSEGNELKLEITLTQDREGDIQAALGRSNSRSLNALKEHIEKVKKGKAHPLERVSSLGGNVLFMVINRIKQKTKMNYGRNVALIIRDTSPLDWEWDLVIDKIRENIYLCSNPYDKGIWLISNSLDKIYQII